MSALSGTIEFDPYDYIYNEHFPGCSVVPGSMIIHAFIMATKQLGQFDGPYTAERFRFKRFVSPGEYAYRIEPNGDNELKCILYEDNTVVVTGVIRLWSSNSPDSGC